MINRDRVGWQLVFIMILFLAGSGYVFGEKVPHAGIGIRGSAFGIPNQLLDLLIYEHPEIKGQSYAFEIRSYGSKGPKGVFSGLYSLEYSKMSGEGAWRDEQDHRRLEGEGEISQVSLTATIIMSIFPRSPVHLYIGGGLGIGRVSIWYEGTYTDEVGTQITEKYEEERVIPVAHVPIGIAVNIGNRAEIRLEGGFKNGFYLGGGIVFNF
jgi:opacity protein-like surface antigen